MKLKEIFAIAMSIAAEEKKSKIYIEEKNFEDAGKSEAENLSKTTNDSRIIEEFHKKLEKGRKGKVKFI